MGSFVVLRLEIDGHFHGGPPIKPWVAEVGGPCPKYGLQREFIRPKNDWKDAHRAWSGNIYGRVATFFLRDGRVYEIARCVGNSSKRRLERYFARIDAGKPERIKPVEALAHADGGGDALIHELREDDDTWIARIAGLGVADRLGFVLVGDRRVYRLRDGVYQVSESGRRGLVGARAGRVHQLTEQEAWSWLT